MKKHISMASWVVGAIVAVSLLSACERTQKRASAGGGASNQSMVILQGASR